MELNTLDGKRSMPDPLDHTVLAGSADDELTPNIEGCQRVVAGRSERVGQPGENSSVIVSHLGNLPVSRLRRHRHGAPIGVHDDLKAETDPEYRDDTCSKTQRVVRLFGC